MVMASATDEDRDFEPLEPSTLPSQPSFKFDQNNSSSRNLLGSSGSGYESQYGSMFGSRASIYDGSGVFLSSLALTIIVSAIAIIGIVLVAVIITLSVLLSSCDSRSTITLGKQVDFSLCNSFRLNIELGNSEEWVVPSICEDYMAAYIHEGQYQNDIEVSVDSARLYLNDLKMQQDQKYAVLLDVDETAISNGFYQSYSYEGTLDASLRLWRNKTVSPILPVLDLYRDLHAENMSIFFVSERPISAYDLTVKNLLETGYENWTALILRSADDKEGSVRAYKARKRSEIEMQGYKIVAVLGDQWSDIAEPALGTRAFKLPNPMYHVI